MSNFFGNKKLITIVLCAVFVSVTLITGVFAIIANSPIAPTSSQSGSDSSSAQTESSSQDPTVENVVDTDEPKEEEPVQANRPSEMRAFYLTPGEDYLTTDDHSAQKVKAEIDTAFSEAKELTMNTVIIPTRFEDSVIFQNTVLPTVETDFDVMDYIISTARDNGMYVYMIYDAMSILDGSEIAQAKAVDAQLMDTVNQCIAEIVETYSVDGLMIDNYYNPSDAVSYASYLKVGGGIGYDNFLLQSSSALVKTISNTIREKAPHIQVGLLTDAVWANQADNEAGSATSATFTTFGTGHADTKKYIEDKLVDFVAVEAFGSTSDSKEPFGAVVEWWGALAAANEMPMYVVHASDKICTQNEGWSSYLEISKQVDVAQKTVGFQGSAFNNLQRLIENPNNATTQLLKYYNTEEEPEKVLKELTIANPQQTTYTTAEPQVIFSGASDPTEDVTLNGEKLTVDQNGYFSITKDLEPGLNEFVFQHKEKTITYKITRDVKVLKEVTPVGSMTVDGDMKVTLSALAYKDSVVTATVNGQTVQLTQTDTEDDNTDKTSYYVKYEGVFTTPAATSTTQSLGAIQFSATWGGKTETAQGASVTINKKPVIGSGKPVEVIVDQAETFPTDTINDYSDSDYFPLPKGARDYIIGDVIVYKEGNSTYSYYKLQSDLRVYSSNVRQISSGVANNEIKGITVTSDASYTYVTLNTEQQVSYTARYSSSAFQITFHNTSSVPSSMSLNVSPLFQSANWSGSTLSLGLKTSGYFLGYKAYYDTDGNLVFRFNNPPASLSAARIVIDPGHGNSDPGALGSNPNYTEAKLNQMIAKKVADALMAKGCKVYLLDTDSTPVTMASRISQAKAYNAQVYVSIHHNSAASLAQGSEAYYFYSFGQPLASRVSSGIASGLATNNRGAKSGLYYVTRDPQFTSILAEVGFVTTPVEYAKLIESSYQTQIANNIADAVVNYLAIGGLNGTLTGTQSNGDVQSTPVTGVTLDQTSLSLKVGQEATLTATVNPSGATNRAVSWSSSNPDVATVNEEGLVVAKGVGSAEITVKTQDGEKTATCAVTVSANETAVESVNLDRSSIQMTVGGSDKLTVTLNPSGATNQKVAWSSSNTSVVTVDANGNLTAVGPGEATITVTSESGGKTAQCKVTVSAASGSNSASGSGSNSLSAAESGSSANSSSSNG